MGESPSNIRKMILTNSTNDQGIDMSITYKCIRELFYTFPPLETCFIMAWI
jgi:hypothetical protein